MPVLGQRHHLAAVPELQGRRWPTVGSEQCLDAKTPMDIERQLNELFRIDGLLPTDCVALGPLRGLRFQRLNWAGGLRLC